MTKEELAELVNSDLKNELKHLQFYLHAGAMLRGLHREELKEFLWKEAASELLHCQEFAELVVHLGGVPTTETSPFQTGMTCPVAILKYVVEMENQVAEIYRERLVQTHEMETPAEAYAHVFYEDQIKDSQRTAWEVEQMIVSLGHDHGGECGSDAN
jgi:bacterioferritin (cytochrome b1)